MSNEAPKPKKENRGGYRPGSGRKPQTLSQNQVRLMLKAAKAKAKEKGKSLDDILLDIAYSAESSVANKLAAIKLFKDFTMARSTEKDVTVTQVRVPQVFIPEKYPDSDEAPDYVPADTQH